jgi:hypothetical protein
MKNMVIFLMLLSLNAFPCDGGMNLKFSHKSFIPEKSFLANDMTAEEFKNILKDFENFFTPHIDRDHNEELFVFGSWGSNTINAFAEKKPGKVFVTVFGGLARHKAITKDGLVAVLCHELGHHFGGYPKKSTNRWSSAEGQADYYATMKCLRRFWEKADNAEAVKGLEVPPTLKSECEKSYKEISQRQLCERLGMAGKSVSLMIQDLDYETIEPKFDTPDPIAVRTINYMHPYSQCRLDTFFQGSLCPASASIEFDNEDERQGSCHPSMGDDRGNRPKCWFVHR